MTYQLAMKSMTETLQAKQTGHKYNCMLVKWMITTGPLEILLY